MDKHTSFFSANPRNVTTAPAVLRVVLSDFTPDAYLRLSCTRPRLYY